MRSRGSIPRAAAAPPPATDPAVACHRVVNTAASTASIAGVVRSWSVMVTA